MKDDEASPSANAELAAAVITAAIESGVDEWVVCAGARNLPLIVSLMAMPEKQRGRVWNNFEERSAAFFALGRMKAGAERVAVLTTSGTAAAELLPATIEAHYSGHSLLLITADRPAAFRGTGAPQAIEQMDLLIPYVSRTIDLASVSDTDQFVGWVSASLPEHWNACFEEPRPDDGVVELAAAVCDVAFARDEADEVTDESAKVAAFCSNHDAGRLVVLLGDLLKTERATVETDLVNLGAPIWAEASSGLRESEKLRHLMIANGESQIGKLRPGRVLRIGGVPSCRFWRDLEYHREVKVLSLSRTRFSGLARDSEVLGLARLQAGNGESRSPISDAACLDKWLEAFPSSEPALFRRLSEKIDPADLVYLGNSLPIREWNLAASFSVTHCHCYASRGANGIDGQISTFLGLSADKRHVSAWGIFGDLTTLYDLSAPFVLAQLPLGTTRRIVVVNNGGGRIFDRLSAVQSGSGEQTDVIRNFHTLDFRHWAAMWGMPYACWQADGDWTEPDGDAAVIEIRPDQAQTSEFWNAWADGTR